jgi:hypothetical protein
MNKYHNSKIYTIRSYKTDLYYIGSTTQSLSQRMAGHRGHKKHTKARDILIFDDAYIELLENIKCENKEELTKREGELIREHKNNIVNICINGRTYKEYRNDNKEKMKEYNKKYQLENKDRLNELKKKYRDEHKEHKKEYDKQYQLKKKNQLIVST